MRNLFLKNNGQTVTTNINGLLHTNIAVYSQYYQPHTIVFIIINKCEDWIYTQIKTYLFYSKNNKEKTKILVFS